MNLLQSLLFSSLVLGFLLPLALAVTQSIDESSVLTDCSNIEPRFPAPNMFACYRTTVEQVGPFQTCSAQPVRVRNISSTFRNENYSIFYLNTPGRLRERTYVNRLLCRWNIQCPSNQLLYMDIVEHNIEPQHDSRIFQDRVCVDYLYSFRDFGLQVTCGALSSQNDLEPNRLLMEFRSNQKLRFPGFRVRVVCFNPELQDQEGCSIDPLDTSFSSPAHERTGTTQRRKRVAMDELPSNPMYLQSLPKALQSVHHRARKSPDTVKRILVPEEDNVVYVDGTVKVLASGSVVQYTFESISSFHTFNQFDGSNSFYPAEIRLQFRGFGRLFIIESSAYYQIFGVDPIFQPSVKEEEAIRMLLQAEEELVIEDDFIIEETEPIGFPGSAGPPGARGPPGPPGARGPAGKKKRQVDPADMMITNPEIVDTAVTGANSCNAVIRAVAQSILSFNSEA